LGYGVSSLKWSPCGRYLWVSGRNSSEISCWDVRGTKRQVGKVSRSMSTKQKCNFDIDPWGQYLLTGDDKGHILSFSTKTFELVKDMDTGIYASINSCYFHPYSSIIVATQGERTFPIDNHVDEESDDEDSISRSSSPDCNPEDHINSIETTSCTANAEDRNNNDILTALLGKRKALEACDKPIAKHSRASSPSNQPEKILHKSVSQKSRCYDDISSESSILVYVLQKMELTIQHSVEFPEDAEKIHQAVDSADMQITASIDPSGVNET
jgi:WD40 repeat protein